LLTHKKSNNLEKENQKHTAGMRKRRRRAELASGTHDEDYY
jgi:hypothetical protein